MIIAFQDTSVTISPVSADSVSAVLVTAVAGFRPNIPVRISLDSADSGLEAGLIIGAARYISSGSNAGDLEFEVANVTGSTVTPAAHTFHFQQVQ